MKKLTSWTLALLIACVGQANAQKAVSDSNDLALSKPPKAPIREVTDIYFGTKVVDPYRWMEDSQSTETVAWMNRKMIMLAVYLTTCR